MLTWWITAALLILVSIGFIYIVTRRKEIEPNPVIENSALVPESSFIEIEGAKIHYVQAGQGRDIVLLHGIGASIFIWRFLFPYLQRDFRVTALDLPGFGQSSKDVSRDYGLDAQTVVVARALSELGIDRPVVVGSSMGGAIALWLARTYPERFDKIVTLAPATDRRLVPAAAEHLAGALPILRRALNRKTMKLILKRVLARQTLINDETVDAYMKPFMDDVESVQTFWSALKLLADPRLPDGLADVEAEVLILYGEKDLMVPRKTIDRVLALLPNSKLITCEQGGHHIMEDEPEWTAKKLIEFLRS